MTENVLMEKQWDNIKADWGRSAKNNTPQSSIKEAYLMWAGSQSRNWMKEAKKYFVNAFV